MEVHAVSSHSAMPISDVLVLDLPRNYKRVRPAITFTSLDHSSSRAQIAELYGSDSKPVPGMNSKVSMTSSK